MFAPHPISVGRRRTRAARAAAWCGVLLASMALPHGARASLLSPEAEDALATFIALFVIFVVPVVLIVLFWLVHILPEKIAHQRHHPQFEAIRTLCLLSLVFGGLLWPIAWIWAYSKPVLYKMAYGSDVSSAAEGHGPPEPSEAAALRERLARLEARGVSADDLATVRRDLDALEEKLAGYEVR